MQLIARGELVAGAEELLEAYRIKPHPAVLFNVARAYADAGYYEDALVYLDRYLETGPADSTAVEALVDELRTETERGEGQERLPQAATPGDARLAALEERIDELLERLDGSRNPRLVSREEREALEQTRQDVYDEVVVTASRTATNRIQAPLPTTVITREQILRSGATSIPELLRSVPGMNIMLMGAGSPNLAVRGFNQRISNKLLVLVDGRTAFFDFLGGTFWRTLELSLDDIQRIEVVRGPGSTLYGANAFGGVVNIITRPPGERSRDISVMAGTQSTIVGTGRISGRVGIFGYQASVSYEQRDRYEIEYDEARSDVSASVEDPTLAIRAVRSNAAIAVVPSRHVRVGLSGGFTSLEDSFHAIGLLRDFQMRGTRAHVRGDLEIRRARLRAYWNHFAVEATPAWETVGLPSLASSVLSNVFDMEFSTSGSLELGVRHDFAVGGGFRIKSIDWDYLDDKHIERHLFGFAEDRISLGDHVRLIGGIRLDYHPLVGLTPSPGLTALFMPGERQAIALSVGTAFRTPSYLESYLDRTVNTPVTAVRVRTRGNTDLDPEQNVTVNLGYRFENNRIINFAVDTYWQRISKAIALSDVGPTSENARLDDGAWIVGESQFENLDSVFHAFGAEADVRLSPVRGLDVAAQYTLQLQYQSSGDRLQPILRDPQHQIGVQVGARAPFGLEGGAALFWVSQSNIPERSFDDNGVVLEDACRSAAYTQLNANLNCQFPGDAITIGVAGHNLLGFGGGYRDHCLAGRVGARVLGTARLTF